MGKRKIYNGLFVKYAEPMGFPRELFGLFFLFYFYDDYNKNLLYCIKFTWFILQPTVFTYIALNIKFIWLKLKKNNKNKNINIRMFGETIEFFFIILPKFSWNSRKIIIFRQLNFLRACARRQRICNTDLTSTSRVVSCNWFAKVICVLDSHGSGRKSL